MRSCYVVLMPTLAQEFGGLDCTYYSNWHILIPLLYLYDAIQSLHSLFPLDPLRPFPSASDRLRSTVLTSSKCWHRATTTRALNMRPYNTWTMCNCQTDTPSMTHIPLQVSFTMICCSILLHVWHAPAAFEFASNVTALYWYIRFLNQFRCFHSKFNNQFLKTFSIAGPPPGL